MSTYRAIACEREPGSDRRSWNALEGLPQHLEVPQAWGLEHALPSIYTNCIQHIIHKGTVVGTRCLAVNGDPSASSLSISLRNTLNTNYNRAALR